MTTEFRRLTRYETTAIKAFAKEHGSKWHSVLLEHWIDKTWDGHPVLKRLRKDFGPNWLRGLAREETLKESSSEYQIAIDRLGWSQMHAARTLGLDPRTSRRYALGELEMPQPLAMLLRVLVHMGRTEEWLIKVTKDKIK